MGICEIVDKLLEPESGTADSNGGANTTSADSARDTKDEKSGESAGALPYSVETSVGLSSAFEILSFVSFSHDSGSVLLPAEKVWKSKAKQALFNFLFSKDVIAKIIKLITNICDFIENGSKNLKEMETLQMIDVYLQLLKQILLLISNVVSSMQEASIASFRDKRLLKCIIRLHCMIASEPKYFPHYFGIHSDQYGVGEEEPDTDPEDIDGPTSSGERAANDHRFTKDTLICIRSTLAKIISAFLTTGWNQIDEDFMEPLFRYKHAPLPSQQLGALMLFGDLLPIPIVEYLNNNSERINIKEYFEVRQLWQKILLPLVEQTDVPCLLQMLQAYTKTSNKATNDALIRLLVRLAELSGPIGLVCLEPLVDQTRAEIIKAIKRDSDSSSFHPSSDGSVRSGDGEAYQTNTANTNQLNGLEVDDAAQDKYLFRLLHTIARLLEDACCHWILNDLGIASVVKPLLEMPYHFNRPDEEPTDSNKRYSSFSPTLFSSRTHFLIILHNPSSFPCSPGPNL